MKLLAIEASSEVLSVALYLDGVLKELSFSEARRHAEQALPAVHELLQAHHLELSELDALAFGRGPGAFTGVRMATALAQGLAFALELPVVGISTLQALALQMREAGAAPPYLSLLDARMGELYAGTFGDAEQASAVAALGPEQLTSPSLLHISGDDVWSVAGSGFVAHRDRLCERFGVRLQACDGPLLPRAGAIARLAVQALAAGARGALEHAMPVYLRDRVAKTTAERMAVSNP
jgi:tRNA threonylcarbamoyladenosine biosynthesis protein TsaB